MTRPSYSTPQTITDVLWKKFNETTIDQTLTSVFIALLIKDIYLRPNMTMHEVATLDLLPMSPGEVLSFENHCSIDQKDWLTLELS